MPRPAPASRMAGTSPWRPLWGDHRLRGRAGQLRANVHRFTPTSLGEGSVGPLFSAACRLAALALGLSLAAPAVAQSPAPAAGEEGRLKVVVAVLPFRVHSGRPLDELESSLAERLAGD